VFCSSDSVALGALSEARRRGLKNVDDKMKAIAALVEKWKRIVANWDGSPDTLADLYWNELFSKLDVASYGLD
jgi:hypothetical protein